MLLRPLDYQLEIEHTTRRKVVNLKTLSEISIIQKSELIERETNKSELKTADLELKAVLKDFLKRKPTLMQENKIKVLSKAMNKKTLTDNNSVFEIKEMFENVNNYEQAIFKNTQYINMLTTSNVVEVLRAET